MEPYFFTNIPRKEIERLMAKGKGKPRGRSLTPAQVKEMIIQWDNKTVDELAQMFGTTASTINNMSRAVRKQDSSLCHPKGGRKRKDVVMYALKLLKEEK
jgi:transposase